MSNKMKMNTLSPTIQITRAGCLAALVFVVTRFIQIPIPLGYFNIGNSVILAGCMFFPPAYGIAAGAIGSALADLLSYPIYTIPTLVIKALMPLVFYLIAGKEFKHMLRTMIAVFISTLIPLFGYTLVGGFINGNMWSGWAQFPGLFLEYVANAVLFFAFFHVAKRIRRYLLEK